MKLSPRSPTLCPSILNFPSSTQLTPINNNTKTPFTIVLNRTSKYRRIHHPLNNEQKCRKLVSSIVDSGKFIYINVMGEKDEEIVRPQTMLKKEEQHMKYVGAESQQLTNEERITLDYVNSEIQSKESEIKVKSIIINKFFRAESMDQAKLSRNAKEDKIKYDHNQASIRKRRLSVGNPRREINTARDLEVRPLPASREDFNQNFSNLLSVSNKKEALPQTIKSKDRYRYSVSQQNQRQAEVFIKKRKTNAQNPESNHGKNYSSVDKYDMSYSDYLHKSGQQIDQEYSNKIENSKKHNLVDQYQDYAIRNVLLSHKNKQFALRKFEEINRQRRKLKI